MNQPILKIVDPTYSVLSFPAAKLPDEYKSIIFAKWLRTFRSGNPLIKSIDTPAFFDQYHKYIEMLLSKPDSVIKLAVLTDTPDVVLGFSVSREDVLDYIYVHKDNRKLGIGRKLFPKGTTTMTHVTLSALEIWRNNPKYKHLKYNPFA